MRFPSWVGDPKFDHLTKLMVWSCKSTHLPTLECLGYLRRLVVQRLSEVKTVGFELLATANSYIGFAFPSLEVLEFGYMQGWKR